MKKNYPKAKSQAEMLIKEDSTDKRALQDVYFSLADFQQENPDVGVLRDKLREKIAQLPQDIQDEPEKELSELVKEKDEFDTPEWKRYVEGKSPEEIEKIKAMQQRFRREAESKRAMIIGLIVVFSLAGLFALPTLYDYLKSHEKQTGKTRTRETMVEAKRQGIGVSY
ncbi:MAG: hypothetical protein KAX20_03785, partial [Candidatus Omnitrophica bacterium]|nr:hypothetical protein [Candidatus Omnitrophota bacterium]